MRKRRKREANSGADGVFVFERLAGKRAVIQISLLPSEETSGDVPVPDRLGGGEGVLPQNVLIL